LEKKGPGKKGDKEEEGKKLKIGEVPKKSNEHTLRRRRLPVVVSDAP